MPPLQGSNYFFIYTQASATLRPGLYHIGLSGQGKAKRLKIKKRKLSEDDLRLMLKALKRLKTYTESGAETGDPNLESG